jgi:hypothetical protein
MHNSSPLAHKLRVALLTLLTCVAGVGAAVGTAAAKNGADDTTTTNPSTTPHAPLISEIEADAVSGGRLRLRTEVAARGAKVTSVRIRYRGVSYKATRTVGKRYARTVDARGGDHADSVITLTATACAGSRCATKTGSDRA